MHAYNWCVQGEIVAQRSKSVALRLLRAPNYDCTTVGMSTQQSQRPGNATSSLSRLFLDSNHIQVLGLIQINLELKTMDVMGPEIGQVRPLPAVLNAWNR